MAHMVATKAALAIRVDALTPMGNHSRTRPASEFRTTPTGVKTTRSGAHPFIYDADWNRFHNIEASFVPHLQSITDTT
jgi:hypothetical protein